MRKPTGAFPLQEAHRSHPLSSAIALAASLVVHAGLAGGLMAYHPGTGDGIGSGRTLSVDASLFDSPAPRPTTPQFAKADPPPPPPPPPPAPKPEDKKPEPPKVDEIKAGIADSEHKTETWLGFKDPTPHHARTSEVEQAALTRDHTNLTAARGEDTPPVQEASATPKVEPAPDGKPNAQGASPSPQAAPQNTPPAQTTPQAQPTPPPEQPQQPQPNQPSPPTKPTDKPADPADAKPAQPQPAGENGNKPPADTTSAHNGPGRDEKPQADERKPVEGQATGNDPKTAPGGKPDGSSDTPAPGSTTTDPLGTAPREQAAHGDGNTLDKPKTAHEVKPQDASTPAPAPTPAPGSPNTTTPADLSKPIALAPPTLNPFTLFANPAAPTSPTSPGAQPTPARPALVPHVNPGVKRPGIMSQREADAASLKNALEFDKFQLGRPRAGKGVEFQTVAPEWTTTTLATRHPKEAALELTFNSDGEVENVRFLVGMSTGYDDVDEPLEAACHRWKAKGEFFDKMKRENPKATAPLIVRIIFSE